MDDHRWNKSSMISTVPETIQEAPSDMISHFQGVHDSYTRKAGRESDRLESLNSDISEVRACILQRCGWAVPPAHTGWAARRGAAERGSVMGRLLIHTWVINTHLRLPFVNSRQGRRLWS
jgi:hypothetical protein